MSESPDPYAVAAGLILLVTVLASGFLWIRRIQFPDTSILPDHGVDPWPIGWVNFGIFGSALVVAIVMFQWLGGYFLGPQIEAAGEALTPSLAIAAVLLFQLPMLAVFYGLRRFYPANFAGGLSSQRLSPAHALGKTIPLFIRYLPLVWITALAWSAILQLLTHSGLIGDSEPQELVQLFQAGGHPLAMITLFLLAVILAPMVEELIFRGCIYRFLKSRTAIFPAQVLSAIFFAMMHGNLLSFLPLVLIGVLLARVYERSGSILVPMCFHGCYNGFSLTILLLLSQASLEGM